MIDTDKEFEIHQTIRNWKITKGVLKVLSEVLEECDCQPSEARQYAIIELIRREFGRDLLPQ